MSTFHNRRGARVVGLPILLAGLAACSALNNAYETSSNWVEERWEQATAKDPVVGADEDAGVASLTDASTQAAPAEPAAGAEHVDAAGGTRAAAMVHPGAGFLKSPPLVVTAMRSCDLSSLLPVPGEAELAASAEPVPVIPERVVLEPLGPNSFRVTLRHEPSRFENQRNDEWCWAACAWMVNEQNRRHDPGVISLSQEDLAQYFMSGEEHQAANLSTIMRAITLDLEELHQRNLITVSGDLQELGPNRLVRDLCAGSMPIVGLNTPGIGGHAVIVTGLTYSLTQAGEDQRELARKAQTLRGLEGRLGETRDALDALKGKGGQGKGRKHSDDDDVSDAADKLLEALDRLTDAYAVEEVTLLDPWDPDALVVSMDGATFREQLDFIMTREYARELLSQKDDDLHRTLPGQLGAESESGTEALFGRLLGGG